MLTNKQEKWIAHLSNEHPIKIVPFDPTAEEKFQRIKALIQERLCAAASVEHHGASSLGISGQGDSKSHYPLERARFKTSESGKRVDVFLVNQEHPSWLRSVKFEAYLRSHPEALEEYRKLKESGDGSLPQNYYRKKNEFINEILGRATTS